jgi:hypothetical protein
MIELFKTSPVVFPTVSYESVRCWQRQGAKPLGQCSLYCEHQGGQELGVSSKVNESELLINVVNANKPKMLRGLNQKVSGQAQGLQCPLSETIVPSAKRQHLTYSGTHAERGKPICLPLRESDSQEKPIDVWAWDNRKSKRHLVMRWIVSVDTLRKQADFGVGLSSRKRMPNPLWREKQMWAVVTLACASLTTCRCGQHHYVSGRSWL